VAAQILPKVGRDSSAHFLCWCFDESAQSGTGLASLEPLPPQDIGEFPEALTAHAFIEPDKNLGFRLPF